MADQSDVREVEKGKVSRKRRFDKRDFDCIGDYIIEEHARRKKAREPMEREWADIDRQLHMEPDVRMKKKAPGGSDIDPKKAWMAEMELPLQAQALEVLTADARRLMFPGNAAWYRAHAAMTDGYLDKVDFQSMILGDEMEAPSQINQDNIDRLVEGWIAHLHRQYDFFGHYDHINAEAFKYGTGIGRVRMVRKSVFARTAKGVVSDVHELPVLLPRSVKNVYLDDSPHAIMNEGHVIGPGIIAEKHQLLEDLALAANRGSTDPDREDGGWMPAAIKGLEAKKDGTVQLLEFEGDLVVPRKTVRSLFIPGAIVTVAVGGSSGNKTTKSVVRFRFRKTPQSSYIVHPYHQEDLASAYATSPLMKGRPIQIAATDALNRMMDGAALLNQPPVQYNRDDMYFAQQGGPQIAPGETWGTTDDVQVVNIGNPTAMLQAYGFLLQQYADMTGVNAPRLGAQTVSHTTAFAKEAELSRGTIRTVDYVSSVGHGQLTQFLDLEYRLSREALGRRSQPVYLDTYGGFVEITKERLPETVVFEWFGSSGPAEQAQKAQQRLQAAQMAIQMDNINMQTGGQRELNLNALIQQVLREGGWTDTDAITQTDEPPAPPTGIDAGQVGVAAIQQLMAANE